MGNWKEEDGEVILNDEEIIREAEEDTSDVSSSNEEPEINLT